jgi:muramoyltetrapeptide carboxypeptidase
MDVDGHCLAWFLDEYQIGFHDSALAASNLLFVFSMENMAIIKPKALRHGATLGIVATSTPIHLCGSDTIGRFSKFLNGKGFNLVEASNCRKLTGHTAGSIEERVQEFHRFFEDPKIDAILSFWGGYNSHQMLEHLDFDLIKRNPKPFIGYSDITSLQLAIYVKTGLVTFSGPAGISFGKPIVPDYTWRHFEAVLTNAVTPLNFEPAYSFSDNRWWECDDSKMIFDPAPLWRTYRTGSAEGPIVGGNGGTMLLLAGTEFWPELKGAILFIEDDECENPKTIDRIFFQLRHIGAFENISGLVVGRFPRCVEFSSGDSLEMILNDALHGYDFPVLLDVDFGHTDPLLTLPIGIRCRLDSNRKTIELIEAAVQ